MRIGARGKIKVRLPQYLAAPHFIVGSDMLWTVPRLQCKRLRPNASSSRIHACGDGAQTQASRWPQLGD